MNKMKQYIYSTIIFIMSSLFYCKWVAAQTDTLMVSQNNRRCFQHIQDALNSIPVNTFKKVVIFIANGTYNEKLLIQKTGIELLGEDKDKTIITQSIARDIWRCNHPSDWGVATVNISASDIVIKNLTIQNTYGFDNNTNTVSCSSDTAENFSKIIRRDGHQMALRTFAGTRLKVINCNLKAFGGDTVSPWNVTDGMFYFKDCTLIGGVDFYCPRGWAYAENCSFIATTGTACIWHDGSANEDAKTVFKNCRFDGYKGFLLGRFHKDAQFYLVNCHFSENMANKPIYLVPTQNVIQWGYRVYYYNCHRTGGDYDWFKNNLTTAKGSPLPQQINAQWVFSTKWNPILNE
jgi:pectinesterase